MRFATGRFVLDHVPGAIPTKLWSIPTTTCTRIYCCGKHLTCAIYLHPTHPRFHLSSHLASFKMEHLGPLVQSAARSIVLDTLGRNAGLDHSTHDHSPHGGSHSSASSSSTSNATAGGGDHSMHMMGDHLMSPYLFGNMKPFFVLFRDAKVSTGGTLAAALVVSCVFSILVTMYSMYSKKTESQFLTTAKRVSVQQLLGSVLFAFRMFLHYIAMLLVMTMNIWVILAVVLGHAIGHVVYAIAFHGTKVMAEEAGCDDC